MANFILTAGTGAFALTGQPVKFQILGDLKLDAAGPFYQFVLTYLVASAGLTPVYDATNYSDFLKDVAGVFPGIEAGDLRADLPAFIQQVRGGALPQRQAEQSLCCMLANTAFESVDEAKRKRLKGHPVFEVFRHVRNAASHKNVWHFRSKKPLEPKFRGQWKGFVIDETLQGDANPLQGSTCFYGTLKPADLLYLLQDIEGLLT
jgi:hypothetical protein